jgi:Sulfatase
MKSNISAKYERNKGIFFMNKIEPEQGRNFKQKLWVSLAVSSFFGLTLFFFGPFQIYMSNSASFAFMFDKVILRFLPIALIVLLVVTAILLLLPEKLSLHRKFAVLALTGAALLWLQGNIILWDYGVLDGNEIQWAQHRIRGFIDGGIWIAVLILAMVKAKQIYKYAIKISVFFILIQVLYTGVLFFQYPAASKTKNYLQLDFSQQFDFSSKRNVIVMILDGFQTDLFQEIIDDNPEYRNMLDGFTYQRNSLSGFPLTQASIPFILTGAQFDNSRPYVEFVNDAYFSDSSIPWVLKEKGFQVENYMDCNLCLLKDRRLLSNLKDDVYPFYDTHAGYIFDLTLFKYAPHFFKPHIYNKQKWRFKNYLRSYANSQTSTLAKKINPISGKRFSRQALEQLFDVRFIAGMLTNSRVNNDKDTFKFIHLKGVHAPFHMNEQLEYVTMRIDRPSWKKLSIGSLNVAKLFLQQLKRLGIYDNSMVFIIADHGHSGGYFGVNKPPQSVKSPDRVVPVNDRVSTKKIASALPLILVKPFGASGPLKITDSPVSLSDIPHTLFTALGISGDFVGRDMFCVDPSEDRTRRFTYFQYEQGNAGGAGKFPKMSHYTVTGHSWLVESWSPYTKPD